jgi:hypothetical protein
LVAGAQEVARLGTNIFGSNTPNPPRTTEQAREQAKINRAQSAMRRTDSEIEMERNATGRVASSDDLTAFIERSKDVSGNSTLSPQEQQRARQLQQNLPKSDLPSDLNKNNTNNNSGGSQPVSVGGSQPVSVGDYDPQEHPPADPSSPTPPSSTTTTPATDDELEKRVKARIAGRDRNKQLAMQQGEENVAFLQAKGAPNDPVGRGRHAVALLRAQRRAKGGDGSGLSDEQIRGQEERQLARERRTPEEKAAEKAKNDAALADMNKRAAEMRAEEEARKGKSPVTSTGTKTASSSQTSPQSYRI